MSNKYRLTISLILTTLLAGGSATAGVVINGSVFGGGNEADVQTNTTVNISAGQVKGNVYGGGNLGDVGKINDKSDPSNYTWTDNTGVSKVNITGGLIGDTTTSNNITANVFGGGKGNDESFYCEKGMVYSTKVRITKGAVNGDVYGGGQIARVESNTIVTIGSETGDSVADIKGNVFGAGAGLETHGYSALVRGNPVVTIQGNAKVAQDVYGGGKIASVGRHKVKISNGTPYDAPEDLPNGMPYTLQNTNSGICRVDIKGSAEIAGNVFGAGQGLDPVYDSEDKPTRMAMGNITETFDTEEDYFVFLQTLALTTETDVTISGNATVKGSVYGGSKSGFVQYHTDVKILGGTIGETNSDEGNIYGGGRGVDGSEFAGRVSGNTKVTIGGGTTYGDVYGGGAYSIVKQNVVVNVDGGEVKKDVYGGGALANTNTANWNPDADNYSLVNGLNAGTSSVSGLYTRSGDIYTLVTGDNPTAADGTDYYSKGSWADNTNKSALYTTRVVLTGGTVTNVYGGALGDDDHRAKVYGDIAIYLNGIEDVDYNSTDYGSLSTAIGSDHMLPTSSTGAIVNKLFGANNLYGTPMGHVKVHVFATQNKDNDKPTIIDKFVKENTDVTLLTIDDNANESETAQFIAKLKGYLHDDIKLATELGITTTDYQEVYDDATADADAIKTAITDLTTEINNRIETNPDTEEAKIDAVRYDVQAVYGGGNLSAYVPFETNETTEVIIDGCDYTSIRQVYGGGNAASVSSSHVIVNGTYEINDVFGGGNGNDPYTLDDKHYLNPGANVGYYNYTHWGNQTGTEVDPIQPIDNDDALTKDDRIANYRYGAGIAKTEILGGTIHSVFGGSNQKGNISNTAISIYDDLDDDCPVTVDETYGGGKNAPMDGQIKLDLDCVKNMPMIFGGAKNADIYSDIVLNITNGSFNKVFGGNNEGGAIYGSITVNVEEKGCQPIEIGELYGGGYLAPYSIYGYEKYDNGNYKYYKVDENNQFITDGDGNYVEWTTSDGNVPRKLMPLVEIGTDPVAPYNQPHINIISATRIGKVFGGGYKAMMVGNPHVNVNMKEGKILKEFIEGDDDQILPIGTIDTVYGGGYMATVIGSTYVEIGTGQWYIEDEKIQTEDASGVIYTYNSTTGKWDYIDDDETKSVDNKPAPGRNTAKITGSIYGGGLLANITGNTQVNIGVNFNSSTENWESVSDANITIAGNVFGGGKGEARVSGVGAFFCDDAMVGEDNTNDADKNDDPAYADKGTHVRIGNGTVGTLDNEEKLVDGTGNVYGGGEIGRVEFHTEVIIGLGEGTGTATKSPVIHGNVFGAGKGNNTHGYSGLVRGNSTVTVQGDAKVGHNIYGGGEMASVGKYEVVEGLPKTPLWGGKCTVTIQGYAEIGPNGMLMTQTGGPDDIGHVFGAGKGTLPYENVTEDPWSMQPGGIVTYNENEYIVGDDGLDYQASYYKFIQTLGLASNTNVTIGEHAFIKGSVYGGSENGYVQANTHVTIAGGQIGVGQGKTAPYDDDDFIDPSTTTVTVDNALATCATWTYDKATTGKPYDKYATHLYLNEYYYDEGHTKSSEGGSYIATDGHTYYGNVFGGGRGVVPFAAGKWHRAAGSVGGNTRVDITAGHILSSVYGGNEHTDVGSYELGDDGEPTTNLTSGGTCIINMSGGTVGVPRTKDQIDDNPVIGNVFGAGKGDKRVLFNTWTNVGTTSINISGTARIYGSVFGGGEDGHVMDDAVTNIGGTVTTGIGDNATTHNYSKVIIGSTGTSGADGNVFGGGRGSVTALTAGVVGGNVNLTIDNGQILGNVYGGGRLASVGTNFKKPKLANGDPDPLYGKLQTPETDHGNITVTVNGGTIGSENSTGINGNIFGGGKGTETDFQLGIARSTTINMTGGTAYASVYGGGELAQVVGSHTTGGQALGTEINISGGTIGTTGKGEAIWGNVYGGGKGNITNVEAGLIKANTKVTISEANATDHPTLIYHNVYGGGAYGSVGTFDYSTDDNKETYHVPYAGMPVNWTAGTGVAEILITGGTIGTNGDENGMVFGSSRGDVGAPNSIHDKLAWVYDANVTIGTQGSDAGPEIKGSVYGSGENGHTGNDASVTIHSGTIGILSGQAINDLAGAAYPNRGNVYGGGCGTDQYDTDIDEDEEGDTYNPLAGIVRGNTIVTMDGGTVAHNIYGAGAMGSVGTDGVDISGKTTINISGGTVGVSGTVGDGNVYGAARGDLSVSEPGFSQVRETDVNINPNTIDGKPEAKIWGNVFGGGEAGIVKQDVNVEVNGGTIVNDVYGGGALAHTNIDNWDSSTSTWAAGKTSASHTTSVTMSGGNVRDVYGGGLGQKNGKNNATSDIEAKVYGDVTVTTTGGTARYLFGGNNLNGSPQGTVTVNINGTDTPELPATYAIENVYGGGNEAAYTYTGNTPLTVSMTAGYVNNIFGGGNLADVAGSIDVTVSGGTVVNDVYGGGALANTNTANWNTSTDTWYEGMIDGTTGVTTYKTTVNLNGGVIGNAYGGALGQLGTGVHYTQEDIDAAQEGEDAYGKTTADWIVEPANGVGAVKAMVYGDVAVTVNGATLPAVVDYTETVVDQEEGVSITINILKGGRVFGCNNINGTPKGKVKVTVNSTSNYYDIQKDKSTLNDRFKSYYKDAENHDVDKIDVAAVFGGGNAADYEPVTNQSPKVLIDGCSDVSIGSVYGGGNAAAVPSSDVEIRGAYYIQYVFGGGNGAGSNNRGANVGYKSYPTDKPNRTNDEKKQFCYNEDYKEGTNVNILGGFIENAFGGCDTKGDVYGTGIFNINESGNCPLQIGCIYGGGRRAPQDGDVYTLIDCPSSYVRAVYGGSEMADIHGNVILTIAAGRFDEVFGGNRKSGVIDGSITVNIEETSVGCRPIIITNLYGGCDDAPYSGAANSDGYNVTVNAKAFTSIGSLFGGSKGANAILTGNTLVNVNQTLGYWAGKHYPLQVPGEGGQNVDNTNPADLIPNQLGTIGTIYGGGDLAQVDGNTVVNIGTETTVGFINEPTHLREDPEVALTKTDNLYYVPVLGANITGDVYGGGNLADVTGNTYVNICANKSGNDYVAIAEGTSGVSIGGNVFGGGKGKDDNFECDKAMVGTEGNYGANNTGSTYVHIGNGTIGNGTTGGNVYGGGMVGRVEANTNVTVGFGDGVAPEGTPVSAPVINGSLYGAGQGVATHGYSGLVRGNSTVTIKGNTQILGSVYGGGQKATVGRFWVKGVNNVDEEGHLLNGAPEDTHNRPIGMPYAPMAGGNCTVIIGGYAEIGPDDMMMTATGGPDDAGHVFGACKGIIPYQDTDTKPLGANEDPNSETAIGKGPGRWYAPNGEYTWQPYSNNETAYLEFIETLALASNTEVTITGHAFIKGSVYGGSENGRVLDSTYVKIQESCQIGAGFNKSTNKSLAKYDEEDFIDPTTATAAQIEEKAAILQECNSWPYQAPYAPYDPNAIYQNQEDGKYYYDASYQKYAEGGMPVGSDGHTFYGNVFGGGSGYYPYKDSNTGESKWHWEAGSVGGNTRVEISGGHILTNLYGGNELTNVGHGATVTTDGKSTIVMSGGTLGVPRTLDQIAAHPVTCYLFGAGKGDQRVFFNKQTNVNDVDISITGGTIYGSVFGGGEDGHVMRDVTMVIGNTDGTGPTIGTWGTSYVDGNIFGGGRGFSGDAYTAGNVGGSVDLKIKGGTMLGSIYGGGRLGSVGYGLYASNETGYGEMRDDNKFDDGTSATGFKRGYVEIEISGGTIGNDYECIIPQASNMPTGLSVDTIESWTSENWTTWKNHNHVPYTEYELYVDDDYRVYRLSHAKGGNVFAGGMGRREQLDGVTEITAVVWKKLGNVKSTKLTITGGTIKSNVYGGGELGSVLGAHSVTHGMTTVTGGLTINAGTEIRISGSSTQIGTSYIDATPSSGNKYDDSYYFGSVYGGGKGSIDGGGDISYNTYVEVTDGKIMQNIYGGGQLGSVGKITSETVHSDTEDDLTSNLRYAYYNFGLSWPIEFSYEDGTGNTYILIKGGRIGTTGSENGDVFGGCKGTVLTSNNKDKDEREATRIKEARIGNVNNTFVEVDYSGESGAATASDYTIEKVWEGKEKPKLRLPENKKGIAGSVYGGAEDGHVYNDTKLTLINGLVGHALYGGGKGKGTYKGYLYDASKFNNAAPTTHDWKTEEEEIHSINAGRVYGNTKVIMENGYVMRSIYGGGNLGSVGIGNYSGGSDDYSNTGYGEMPSDAGSLWNNTYFKNSGKTSVTVKAGQIGYLPDFSDQPEGIEDKAFKKLFNKDDLPTGNVFGGSRGITSPNGSMSPRYLYYPDFFLGYTNESEVIIGTTNGGRPIIYGSVYGGGQDGHIRRDAKVTINDAEIGIDYDDAQDILHETDIRTTPLMARGNIYGAGSGIGKFSDAYNYSSGSVTCATEVEINGGIIYQNVYGGGALASIGPPNTSLLTPDPTDDKDDESDKAETGKLSYSYTKVSVNGGQIGNSAGYSAGYGGNVFAASRGNEDLDLNTTMFATDLWSKLLITDGTIYGSAYGGGEFGIVKCGVDVNILGGTIMHDVYGGGAIASTNTSNWGKYVKYSDIMGTELQSGESVTGLYTYNSTTHQYTQITENATAAANTEYFDQTWVDGKLTTEGGKYKTQYNTKVNLLGGTIHGDVYGGALGRFEDAENNISEINAYVYGDVTVNLNGMEKADHDANTSLFGFLTPTDDNYMVPTSITEDENIIPYSGAIVNRIFGGNNLKGTPKGHIKVHVFATQNSTLTTSVAASSKYAKHPVQGEELQNIDNSNETYANYLTRLETTYDGVSQVTSAITSVRSASETLSNASTAYDNADDNNKPEALDSLNNAQAAYDNAVSALKNVLNNLYDVEAVYGGGNLAAYIYGNGEKIANTDANKTKIEAARTEVIIDGCDFTSIRQVYAGGNAASAPGTFVEINGSYEIDEAFGGGNGADPYVLNNKYYNNPGANVGYYNYTHWDDQTGVDLENAYNPIDNTDASTPEKRRAIYGYGSGIATTDIRGGTIHYVFGGSNKKGNISTTALSVYTESFDDCPIIIHETYGGGKDAPIDGEIELTLDCVKDMDMIFGGSKNADVNNNITLNITNGKFKKVFGGNNTSGAINGSITVNVEESGCVPIEIDELYGGGYLAPYSIYGYEKDGYGNYVTEPVTYIDDDNVERSLDQRKPLTSGATHYNDPRINIISATRIGTVYGGGYQAKVVGSPYVNVNMTNGKVEVKGTVISGDTIYKDGHDTIYAAVIADTIRESGSDVIKEIKHYAPLEIGTIDTIYGGGNLASIIGDTHVEIGTGRWVTSWDSNGNPIYETVDVNGNKYIYKVDTLAVTYSNEECAANNDTIPGAISESTVLTAEQATRLNELLSTSYSADSSPILADAKKYNETLDGYITTADVKKPAVWAWYDKDTVKLDVQAQPTPARYAANITGDVFGGGKGKADNFTCDKAMIGDAVDLPNPAERNGGTNVIIANGTVGGSVYGGGMIARVEKNTAVTIGFESGIGEPIIGKDVFGAGMGTSTHGYAGLVRGNSSVIIQGNSKVKGSVYGGGMQASLGRYFVATSQALATLHKVKVGMPYDLKNGGKATVIVQGNAEIGPDTLLMTAPGGPQNTGHVFGAGKGTRPYESDSIGRYFIDVTDGNKYKWQSYKNHEDAYIEYIETLGITNETEVTIGGNAFIKGSVYGGSESGFVLKNTHVTIQDNCQIGNGLVQMADDGTYLDTLISMNRPYSAQEWAEGHLIMTAADSDELQALVGSNYTNSLPECSSWPYEAPYAPYDRFADANGRYPENSVDTTARGGRPTGSNGHTFYGNVFGGGSGYDPYKPGKWHNRAGSVGGNTVVDITGGHILTSLYGGNEMTNVDGTATINMTGGTLGVPRTLGQIAAHPVTCYLFGAGKGDMRTFFNTETNVESALINISGSARIYGSVFGGGEDGHVLGDVTLNILAGDSIIVDDKKIQYPYIGTTGTSYVDGNVFGAGRGFDGEALTAGSVGGNIEVNITGGTMLGSIYGGGRLASVGIGFNAVTDAKYGQFTEDTNDKTYGHITVNISGGTIGNDWEFRAPISANIPEGLPDDIDTWSDANWTTWKTYNKIPNTTFDKETRRPIHTKGGNVFGGSMGRLEKLDGTINPMWPQLGQAKTTNINISGNNTVIKGNVYGGGELGSVRDSSKIVVGKESISGTTITNPIIEHDVYGGGYGSSDARATSKASVETKDASNNTHLYTYTPIQWAGMVGIETHVNIFGGHVKRNVYGGGEMATVGIINYEVYNEGEHEGEYIYLTKHDDEDNGFILSWPYELKYVPGYEGVTTVNIKGGRIGLSGKDYMGPWGSDNTPLNLDSLTNPIEEDNGDVYGGGKGIAGDRYSTIFCANVYATEVNIDLPTPEFDDIEILTKSVKEEGNETKDKYSLNLKNPANGISSGIAGSVYGGAENGHVIKDAKINIKGGYIGHAVYGGGKGKGTYETTLKKLSAASDDDTYTTQIYSITAGKVFGNTEINMSDGWVMRNIYGGGNMGSVGVGNYAGAADDYWDTGYGEKITGSLWTPSTSFNPNLPISTANIPVTNADYFLSSGKSKVTITGGTVGYLVNDKNKKKVSSKDDLPTGNVFGGCRGESAPNITESPRYQYCPAFFSGYVNETVVIIGDSSKIDDDSYTGPTIYGSVYGGGQDGHVRRDTKVTINKAVIGIPFNADNQAIFKSDLDDLHWLHRGNVYGAGSGIGEYEYDFDYDGDYDSKTGNNSEAVITTYHGNPIKEKNKSTSAGSVTRFTNVEINGGTIYRNVYGGGSLSSVGAPKIFQDYVLYRKGDTITGHGVGKQTLNEVIINGGTIGDTISRAVGYGGNVYGASRGEAELGSGFANSVWTTVEANSGHIYGNVFGGGEAGAVTMDTKVIIGGKVPETPGGAPRRAAPAAVQPNAVAPAGNAGNAGNSSPSTPANVATEAPVNRSITTRQAQ